MAIKLIDGFDQYQGQVGSALLSSLTGAGYNVTSGLGMAAGRKPNSHALELQVAAGAAGATWSNRANNVRQDLRGVAGNAAGRFVAVGNNGAAVYTDDNLNWLPVILGVSANMKSIKQNANTWLAVGDNGTILRSTNGRDYLPRVSPVPTANLKDVAYGNGLWIIVGSSGAVGIILLSNDDGLNWVQINVLNMDPANCIEYSGANWIIGCNTGRVYLSTDGTGWTARATGSGANVNDIAFSQTSQHWLAAIGNDVWRSVDGGTNWAILVLGLITGGINSITEADGRWVAVGAGGNVRTSDNEDQWVTPSIAGAGTTAFFCAAVSRGARVGYVIVGALNQSLPVATRTAAIYVSLAPPTRVSRTFFTTENKFTIGFAHQSTARGRILSITDVLDMDWPGKITLLGEEGEAIPARNVPYYYELSFDKTNLTMTLHINNVLDITAALPESVSEQELFEITWIAENGAVTRLDDLYFVDSSTPNGELLVDRLGPIQVPLRLPDDDELTEWASSSPGTHWTQIGILPPSTESYIRSATSGRQDLFTSSTTLPADAGTATAPILAVGVIALAQKGDIDNRQLGLAVGLPGPTQKQVVDTTLSIVPEYSVAIFEKAPGDVAWDVNKVLTTPFGVVVRP